MNEMDRALGLRVVDALDEEARAPVQAFARRKDQAAELRAAADVEAERARGEAQMRAWTAGLGSLEPPMPAKAVAPAAEPASVTVDRMRPLVAAIEPAKPKRVRKPRRAKASTQASGDAA
jgi:hypothetical protein